MLFGKHNLFRNNPQGMFQLWNDIENGPEDEFAEQ